MPYSFHTCSAIPDFSTSSQKFNTQFNGYQFDSPVSHCIFEKLHDFAGYLVHFETVYNQSLPDHIVYVFVVNPHMARFFRLVFLSFRRWDQRLVALLYLWSTCSIPTVPRGTVRGILANRKSPPLFVPLVFSISSIGTLWVYSCLRWFLFGSLFGSEWSFCLSSIGVCLFLVRIYSFR